MSKTRVHSNVGATVNVMPRIETVYYFVYELAQCFHAKKDALDSIKTGILDNQIISTVKLIYMNANNEQVAEVRIHIDWQKHTMLAETEDGENITIDLEKSVVDNIVGWRKIITVHIDTLMKQHGVTDVESRYNYRKEITSDKAEYDKALKIMHHVCLPHTSSKQTNNMLQHELDQSIKGLLLDNMNGECIKRTLGCGILEELTVEVGYKKHT